MRNLAIMVTAVVVIVLAGNLYVQQFFDGLPSVTGLDAATFTGDTVITDRAGNVLADIGDHGNHRQNVSIKEISPLVAKATVAIEDKNFYKNSGFDVQGILRAALADIRSHHIVSGGSTITQQLAKQLFLSPDRTYQRKIKEVYLAYQLSKTYTKDQILELYLNKNYYGSQAYGIQAAAQSYFHTSAKNLDLAQSAMLAGLPQAPTKYNPVLNPASAKVRQGEVLNAMLVNGFITKKQSDDATAEKLAVFPPTNNFVAPHFVDYVQNELVSLGFQPGVQQLQVTTTLDLAKQQLAEKIVSDNLAAQKFRDPNGPLDSASISMDPKTGQILDMVGGPDYNNPGGNINMTVTPRNVGSSIKVFTYSSVLAARRATMETKIYDGPSPFKVCSGASSQCDIYNYDRASHGVQPLRVAFPSSLNIAAVKAELALGVPGVLQFYRSIGIFPRDSNGDPQGNVNDYGPSMTLGAYPITLLEEVTGLATLADLGVYHAPEAVLSVTDAHGNVLYRANPDNSRRQAVDPGVAYIVSSILNDDRNRALIFGLNSPLHLPDRHSAAKTGTTDNFQDALTIGYTPSLASVFWVGDIGPLPENGGHTMAYGSDGVFVAAPAWHQFMEEALKGVPDEWYQMPADVVQKGNDWFLADTQNIPTLKTDAVPNAQGTPTPAPYQPPPDPGPGGISPVLPTPTPKPTIVPVV